MYVSLPTLLAAAAAKVSKMGEKIVIVVPMDYHSKVKPILGKRVKLEMDDEVL